MISKLAVAVLATALSSSGCATLGLGGRSRQNLSTSPTMPASEGNVRFAAASNDNTSIELTVKHLAHPEKLTPPASTYVVWTRTTKDAPPQNIGALSVDKNLIGTLTTVSPLHRFELFVTAEGSGQVQQPSGPPLLWTDYGR